LWGRRKGKRAYHFDAGFLAGLAVDGAGVGDVGAGYISLAVES
jgi:hypothetical protein